MHTFLHLKLFNVLFYSIGTPAQATAYVIGQQAIINLRNELERKLGDNFSLKSFHFHLLSQGDTPLTFQEEYMKKYADCMLDKSNDKNCDSMLSYERYHAKCTQIDDFREKRTDRQVFALFKKKMYK